MKVTIKILRKLCFFFIFSMMIIVVSLPISLTAIAPTLDIKILGGTIEEQEQLSNLVSFEVKSEDEKNLINPASYLVTKLSEQDQNVVLQSRSDASLPVASLTKLMTAWVVLKYGELSENYTIANNFSASTPSPTLGLIKDDVVIVEDLLNAMLVGSANDAALILADYIESKTNLKFSYLMNQEAKSLGLKNSRFSNPTGFDSNTNYSSSNDISLLAQALYEMGALSKINRAAQYSFTTLNDKNYSIKATNQLIGNYSDLYAVKTGFTNQALGSMVNILEVNDTRYLIIVIGSNNREQDTLRLRERIIEMQNQ